MGFLILPIYQGEAIDQAYRCSVNCHWDRRTSARSSKGVRLAVANLLRSQRVCVLPFGDDSGMLCEMPIRLRPIDARYLRHTERSAMLPAVMHVFAQYMQHAKLFGRNLESAWQIRKLIVSNCWECRPAVETANDFQHIGQRRIISHTRIKPTASTAKTPKMPATIPFQNAAFARVLCGWSFIFVAHVTARCSFWVFLHI